MFSARSVVRNGGSVAGCLVLLAVYQSLQEAETRELEPGGNNPSSGGRGCLLPNFPDDGNYHITNYNKKIVPGEIASPYTILRYSCNEGYDSTNSISVCRNDNNTWTTSPQCRKRCDTINSEAVLFACLSPKNTSIPCLRKSQHGSIIRTAFKDRRSSMEQELGILQCQNGGWEIMKPASDDAAEGGSCSLATTNDQITDETSATLIEQFKKLESLQKQLSDCNESIRLVNKEVTNQDSGTESSELKRTLRILSQESERLREQIKKLKSDLEKANKEKTEHWATVSALTQAVVELTTFKRTFHNISRLTSTIVLSSPHYLRGLPWKLGIKKFQPQDSNEPYLGVYLYSNEESQMNWSCRAKSELWLLSNRQDMKPFSKIDDKYYEFSRNAISWGWSKLMSWIDLMDPQKGYIKDDSIVLEVQISVEAPQGNIEQETAVTKLNQMIAELTTFKRTFHNISKLTTNTIYSSPHYLRGIPWKIAVRLSDDENPKYFSIYLYGNDESTLTWSCNAKSEVKLLTNKPEVKPIVKIDDKYYKYSQKLTSWGWSKFSVWTEVLDPQKGYVTDDSITIEMQITAEAPEGNIEMVTQVEALRRKIAELTTFRYTFSNIDKLADWSKSPPHPLYGLTWMISMKKFDSDGLNYLGIFLNCTEASQLQSLSKTVTFELRLLSFKPGMESLSFKQNAHNFTKGQNPWGWIKFIEWNKLLDLGNGYVKDNSIVVEAQLSV